MRTIKQKIYNFDELDKEIQERLIDENIQEQVDMFCEWTLETYMQEKAKELIDNIFNIKYDINDIKVYYDLSYCQGSGAMVDFTIPLEDVNKKLKIFTEKEQKIFENYGSLIKIKHNGGNYLHENSFVIDDSNLYESIEYALQCEEIQENKYNKLEQKIETLFNELKEIVYSDINCELKKYGYSLLEDYESFRDQTICFLEENEYYKNGDIYNGNF